jgi:superfamily II DNA or RNA helicase
VPYKYQPIPIYLTLEEYEEYDILSKEIGKMSQYNQGSDISNAYSMKLTRRAKIKKQAANKLVALDAMFKIKTPEEMVNTLIYVDSNSMLEDVQRILTTNQVKSTRFTGSESLEERLSTINHLRQHKINAIVAIKCLDEGVDIPSAVNGIFLSNNTDRREYVQRLGRILRKDQKGNKRHANVYDFIVFPPRDIQNTDQVARNLVKNELIRAQFFIDLAMNKNEAKAYVGDLLDQYGYYFEQNELSYDQQGAVE